MAAMHISNVNTAEYIFYYAKFEKVTLMDPKDDIRGTNLPDPKEIEKEINDFLADKYGNRIRIMGTQLGPWPGTEESGQGQIPVKEDKSGNIRFDMKPAELHEYLDRFVVRQNVAKEILATKIYSFQPDTILSGTR